MFMSTGDHDFFPPRTGVKLPWNDCIYTIYCWLRHPYIYIYILIYHPYISSIYIYIYIFVYVIVYQEEHIHKNCCLKQTLHHHHVDPARWCKSPANVWKIKQITENNHRTLVIHCLQRLCVIRLKTQYTKHPVSPKHRLMVNT